MCSFDVENLFTNVPLQTIDICLDTLFYDDSVLIKGFNRMQFAKLMDLALKDTYFLFNGKIYQQIDGCSMGSPTGPVLANAFFMLSKLFKHTLNLIIFWEINRRFPH